MSKQAAHRLAAKLTDPSAVLLHNVHTVGLTAEAPPRRLQHARVFVNPRVARTAFLALGKKLEHAAGLSKETGRRRPTEANESALWAGQHGEDCSVRGLLGAVMAPWNL